MKNKNYFLNCNYVYRKNAILFNNERKFLFISKNNLPLKET